MLLGVIFAAGMATTPAMAGVVYTNGAPNDANSSLNISGAFSVSDSFTLSGAATLTAVDVGLVVSATSTPTQLTWAFGTTAFGNDIASGTAMLTDNTALALFNNNLDELFLSTFTIDVPITSSGTFWLTFSDGQATSEDLYWNISNGSSMAMDSSFGATDSEAFTLDGTTSATPEPGSLLLLATGLIGLAILVQRKS